MLSAPGATPVAGTWSIWRPPHIHGCWLCTSAHEGSKIWTSWSLLFTKVNLLQLKHDYSLCSLCVSRDLTAGDSTDGTVVDRAIWIWVSSSKARSLCISHSLSLELGCRQTFIYWRFSCCRSFSSCVGNAAHKCFSGCGLVLCVRPHLRRRTCMSSNTCTYEAMWDVVCLHMPSYRTTSI